MTYQDICNEVKKEVAEQMREAILMRDMNFRYEKEYGTAFIGVECYPVRMRSGQRLMVTDVFVAHEDAKHESPLLTAELKKVIPDWDAMKDELSEELQELYYN